MYQPVFEFFTTSDVICSFSGDILLREQNSKPYVEGRGSVLQPLLQCLFIALKELKAP
jgi:hypothetical protein